MSAFIYESIQIYEFMIYCSSIILLKYEATVPYSSRAFRFHACLISYDFGAGFLGYAVRSAPAPAVVLPTVVRSAIRKPQDTAGEKSRKLSSPFLFACRICVGVVAMGVFDRAKEVSGITASEESYPYVCLACEGTFEVQHHSCPVCGSFDVRRSKWL